MSSNLSSMDVIYNQKTGSQYYVLANAHNLVCGIRLWLEVRRDGSFMTDLNVRIRVQADSGFSPAEGMKAYFKEIFPDAIWSKISSNYGSIAFSFSTQLPAYNTGQLHATFEAANVCSKVYQVLLENLRAMDFDFDYEDFTGFFWPVIDNELLHINKSLVVNDPNVVIFNDPPGGAYSPLGNPVTSYQSHLIEVVGLSPAVYEVPSDPKGSHESPDGVTEAPQTPQVESSAAEATLPPKTEKKPPKGLVVTKYTEDVPSL